MTESSNEKIVSRVQALLAKAESTNFAEEADALVAKAQELMARYAIDDAVAQQRRGSAARPELRKITVESPYISAKASLLAAIGRANGVKVVYNRAGEATVIGFAADLDILEVLFSSLLIQATSAMLRVPRHEIGQQVRAFRHAFILAFAHRIGQRLAEARSAAVVEATAVNGGSLVPLFDARRSAVDAMVKEVFPRLSTARHSISHAGGYGAGRAAADRADLGRGRVGGNARALPR